MIASFKTFIFLFVIAFGLSGLTFQKQNNPPEVKLSLHAREKFLKWNSLVTYSITVSDAEDGKSEYNEIPSNEVLLEVRFVADTSSATKFISNKEAIVNEVPLQISKALCFTCHGAKTKVIGPSFQQIAKHYKGVPHIEDSLSARILRGSTGIWSDVRMPPHPGLKKDEVLKFVQWILKNGDDPDVNFFAGLQGAFRTKEKPAEWSSRAGYVLTATYTDHGVQMKQGRSTIVVSVHE